MVNVRGTNAIPPKRASILASITFECDFTNKFYLIFERIWYTADRISMKN